MADGRSFRYDENESFLGEGRCAFRGGTNLLRLAKADCRRLGRAFGGRRREAAYASSCCQPGLIGPKEFRFAHWPHFYPRGGDCASRRARTYIARTAYGIGLLVMMATAWLFPAGTQVVRDVGDLARFGTICCKSWRGSGWPWRSSFRRCCRRALGFARRRPQDIGASSADEPVQQRVGVGQVVCSSCRLWSCSGVFAAVHAVDVVWRRFV